MMNKPNSSIYLSVVFIYIMLMIGGCTQLSNIHESQTTILNELTDKIKYNPINYNIFYSDWDGFKVFDTSVPEKKILIPNISLLKRRVSPDNKQIAFEYIIGDTIYLSILDMHSLNIQHIDKIPNDRIYSFEWSSDSKELAVGYYSSKKRNGIYVADRGKIFITDLFGEKRNVGCQLSKKVIAWLPNNELVVSAGPPNNIMYFVSPDNCKTIASLSIKNKRNIKFSPDGNHLVYYKMEQIYHPNYGRSLNMRLLYISDYRGRNPKIIADYNHKPNNTIWAPNSDMISFDIKSPDWSNIRHVVFYNLENKKTSYKTYEAFGNMPKDSNPHWSPSGKLIAFDRMWERGQKNFEWFELNTMYKDIKRDELFIIASGNSRGQVLGGLMGWIDDNSVVIANNDTFSILNKSGVELYKVYDHPMFIHAIKTL